MHLNVGIDERLDKTSLGATDEINMPGGNSGVHLSNSVTKATNWLGKSSSSHFPEFGLVTKAKKNNFKKQYNCATNIYSNNNNVISNK